MTVLETLESGRLVEDLIAYFNPEGNFAGRTFEDLSPHAEVDLGPADLLAVTLLSVQAPPRAVRTLLYDPAFRSTAQSALGRIPTSARLADAPMDVLEAGFELYSAIKDALGKNAWVTASKLSARLRPQLIPVRDNVVVGALGLSNRSFQQDWMVFQRLMQDERTVGALREAAREAARQGSPNLEDISDLRLLDVALWMRYRSNGSYPQ